MSSAVVPSTPRSRRSSRGFTLVELLTVVALTGILATIGVMLVRKHFADSKTTEAIWILQAIRGAQEAHRAETGLYLNCSSSKTAWFPASPDGKKRAFASTTHGDRVAWRRLGISVPEGTQFGFLAFAGHPGAAYPQLELSTQPPWPTPTPDSWYILQAAGDRDSDGVFSYVVASNFNGELYLENDGE